MRHHRAFTGGLLVLIVLLGSGAAVGQAIPAGGEFQVNTFTYDDQTRPDVAMDADGDFVVVWQSFAQDGSRFGIFGQRYDRSGAALGNEFQINTYTTRDQNVVGVAADADGDFVVVWTDAAQEGTGLSSGIFGRLYSSSGDPTPSEFQINTYLTSVQNNSRVAMDADGGFVVVWQSFGQDGSNFGIFGQRFDSAGGNLGSEFPVTTTTAGSQSQPGLAMNGGGDFVVVWASDDGDYNGIFGQAFDRSGAAVGGEFQVNATTAYDQAVPDVAIDAAGEFVVVWASDEPGGYYFTYSDIIGRRFDSAGNAIGGEFLVNTTTDYIQFNPDVAMQPGGQFVVVWGDQQPGGPYGYYLYPNVAGQRFDSAGQPVGDEFVVNTHTEDYQERPAAAIDEVGNFVVVWGDRGGYYNDYNGLDGSGSGIFGQRYEVPPRALKRGAGETLAALLSTGDPEADERIEEAIVHIEASLADDLWADDEHLTALGKTVFDEEKKAAKELVKLVDLDGDSDSDSDPELSPAAEGAVVQALGSLVIADRKLAETALGEAAAAVDAAGCAGGGSDGDGDSDCDCGKALEKIAKAEQELEAAQVEVDAARFDQAIDRYRKAWEAAQKALAAVSGCPA